jgi:hypothetical protein
MAKKPSQAQLDKWEDQFERDVDDLHSEGPDITVHVYGPHHAPDEIAFAWSGNVTSPSTGKEIPWVDVGSPNSDRAEEVAQAIMDETGWQSTDAWRGFTNTPKAFDDWVKLIDTWVSPMGAIDSQTRHQQPIQDLVGVGGSWSKRDGQPPFEAVVVFSRTSNLFSMGFDIYVRRADLAAARAYFNEVGVEDEDLVRE